MLGGFLRKYGWQYMLGVVVLLLSAWVQLQTPRLLGEIIDELSLSPFDRNKVYHLIIMTVAVAMLTFVTRFTWRQLINGNGRNLEAYLRQTLFTHFQRLSVNFYNYSKTGDLMAYAVNDINAIRMTFGPAFALLFNGISMAVMAITNMAVGVNNRLAVFALAPVPVAAVIMVFMGREVRTRFRKVQEAFASISDRVQENISGLRVIKAYVQEDAEVAHFEKLNHNSRDRSLAMVKVSASMSPAVDLLFGISFTISLIYGSTLVRQGAITIGDFVAFNGYLTMIVQPVRSVSRVINILSRGMASFKRYKSILEVPPSVEDTGGNAPETANHAEVEINRLSFQYPGDPRMALEDISLHIKPGGSLGILGRTGSGKTTLVNLLVRMYNVPQGMIKLGGTDIGDFKLDHLRKSIGYVPQDNFLFSASIMENIRFFSDQFSMAEIERAAKLSAVYDNIMELPDGFMTQVGERGMSLSGGQKQRICLARALILKPRLLILDDSLSAVDVQTESAILESLKTQTDSGGSLIIIAHRVSALAKCDEIIVLDQGRILERGTHDQLMLTDGFYASVAREQMESEWENYTELTDNIEKGGVTL